VTEEERTVEVEPGVEPEATTGPDTRHDPAVYGGDDLTAAFNDRVDGTAAEGVGRVVGLTREDDGLRLTVETQDGRHAVFALADPAEGRLDGRLRRLFHQVGGADGDVTGGLVPLTTVDGAVAIDWERVPEAPTNPSLDTTATTEEPPDGTTLLAGAAGIAAVVALVAGVLGPGGVALAAVAALQVGVAGLLLWARQSDGEE